MTTTERQPLRYQASCPEIQCRADLLQAGAFTVSGWGEDQFGSTWVSCCIAAYDERHAQDYFDSLHKEDRADLARKPFKVA